MSQWYVELVCERQELLAFLSTALQEPVCTVKAGSTDCYYINPGSQPALAARKTSGYFLLSSEFDSLIEDGQVRNRAMEMLPFLNALVKLKISTYAPPLEIDDVFRLDAEGRMIWEGANVIWTHGKNDDFTYSANNAHASYFAARHSAKKYQPSHKSKTMASFDGAEFI